MSLADYKSNVYSLSGEDGVIRELLSRIGDRVAGPKWCVEFGAWDGKFLSNTFHLVESHDWNAVYIESDPVKFASLTETSRRHPSIFPIHALIDGPAGGGTSLDDVLSSTPVPTDFLVLSIDIDSTDLDAWYHHQAYRPAIVCIEVNSSIAPGVLQWHSGSKHSGSSFSAAVAVGRAKGYTLVCHTGNMIFVADEHVDLVGLPDLDRQFPERLFSWEWHDRQSTIRARGVDMATRLPAPVRRAVKKAMGRP